MAELRNLDQYRRTTASPRFGPYTLRGRLVVYPDQSILHLLPHQRVLAVLDTDWKPVSYISARADIDESRVRIICAKLMASGAIEKLTTEKANRPLLYRLSAYAMHSSPTYTSYFDDAA